MPRRAKPDPLAEAVGHRIRSLRREAGLTLEQLAWESEVSSKGYLSDIEKGLARPTLPTLMRIARRLEVDLLDLVTFPDESDRQRLVSLTRKLPAGTVRKLLGEFADREKPKKTRSSRRR